MRIETVELGLVEFRVLRNLGIEALQGLEIEPLVGVVERFTEIQIVELVAMRRSRNQRCSEQQADQ